MEQLPFNQGAEAGLLTRLLLDPAQIPLVSDKLTAEDFYVPEYRRAYSAMVRLSQERKSVDIASMGQDGVGLNALLTQMTQGHRAPAEEYAEIVRRDGFRRRLIVALEKLIDKAHREESRQDLLTALSQATTSIMSNAEDGSLLSPHSAVEMYKDVQVARMSGINGLSYNIGGLDRLLTPAHGGEMIVVAARPSVGKSALADNVADNWAEQSQHPILFVSIEMTVPQLLDRAVARLGHLDASKVIRGQLNGDEQKVAIEVLAKRETMRIWYLDDPHATTGSVRAAAAKLRSLAGGIGGIIIDYMQILKDDGTDSEVQRVTRISRNVKALGREFDCPVLVLSQLNRAVELRDDQHPKLHDLRESGAIEQDADIVIGLKRELGTREMDIEVLKNRQGPVGLVKVEFDFTTMTFPPYNAVKEAVS